MRPRRGWKRNTTRTNSGAQAISKSAEGTGLQMKLRIRSKSLNGWRTSLSPDRNVERKVASITRWFRPCSSLPPSRTIIRARTASRAERAARAKHTKPVNMTSVDSLWLGSTRL
jgi:hypothetical protein